MPGSSLWLIPPATHPLNTIITLLIRKTSAHFNSPHLFIPHLTLTSEISPSVYGSDPQAWLESLKFPSGKEVQIKFENLNTDPVFFRKLYIKCAKIDGVKALSVASRKLVNGYGDDGRAEKWVEETYTPHVSLLYHDCPQVSEEDLSKIEKLARDAGVTMGQEATVTMDEDGEMGGWVGGRVALVPTDKPITEWTPIAERIL